MKRYNRQKLFGKRGQVYMGLLVILTLITFSMLFIVLQEKKEPFTKKIGERQTSVLAAVQEGEKAQIYIEMAAQYAYDAAILDVSQSWYNGDSMCGTYRGVPVVYGVKDCMYYKEDLKNALLATLTGSFNYHLDNYLKNYDAVPLLSLNYDLSIVDGNIFGIPQSPLHIPVFSKTNEGVSKDITKTGPVDKSSIFSFDQWPVETDDKFITSCFGYREVEGGSKYHPGVDVRAHGHQAILAVADGTITAADPVRWGRVVIDHGNGISTAYLHMDSIRVSVGDTVTKGQQIGTSGGRGVKKNKATREIISQGPNTYDEHLHFELYNAGMATLSILDTYRNSGILSDFGIKGAINPLCFIGEHDYTIATNVGCNEYGGAYKFCDLYEKYAPNTIEEYNPLLGAQSTQGCSVGTWNIDNYDNSQTAYQQWELAMQKADVMGYGTIVKLDGNGPLDEYHRLDIGRDTIIFVPCTTDVDKPVELIYYFHDIRGFTYNSFNTIIPQIKEMMEKGRNFIIVYPELPWSWGDPLYTLMTGNCQRCTTSRQSSFIWSSDDGNIVQLHQEVIEHLEDLGIHDIGTITFVDSGGAALWKAAPYLQEIGVDTVKLSDADYYGTSKGIYQYSPQTSQYIFFQYSPDSKTGAPTRFALDFLDDQFGVDTGVLVAGEMYTVPGYGHIHAIPLESDHSQISKLSLAWTPE